MPSLARFITSFNSISTQRTQKLQPNHRQRSLEHLLTDCEDKDLATHSQVQVIKAKCLLFLNKQAQCLDYLVDLASLSPLSPELAQLRRKIEQQFLTESGTFFKSSAKKVPVTHQASKSATSILSGGSNPNPSIRQQVKNVTTAFSRHVRTKQQEDSVHQKLVKMVQWLTPDSEFHRVCIDATTDDGQRCVKSLEHIPKKSLVIYVPRQKMITLQLAKTSEIVTKILEKRLQLNSPKHCILSVYLLQQKHRGSTSIFHPYIDTLLEVYSSFPIFYTQEQKEQLKGSYFLEQLQTKILQIRKDYQMIVDICPELFLFSYDEFCWARMTVCSRIFGVTIHGNRTDALVPLADMLNHHPQKQAIWYFNDTKDGFVIQSQEEIPKGTQIYDSYGKKCNTRFLLNYGFTLDNNDSNEIAFKVDLERIAVYSANARRVSSIELDRQVQDRKGELIRLEQEYIFRVVKGIEDRSFKDLLGSLRYFYLRTKEELEIFENSINQIGPDLEIRLGVTPFINPQVQARCWNYIAKYSQEQLAAYPTSLSEDNKLLQQSVYTLGINRRNCIVLRRGEKEIFQYFRQTGQKLFRLFSMSKRELKKALDKHEYLPYQGYLSSVLPLIK